jgi:hypothetical protein
MLQASGWCQSEHYWVVVTGVTVTPSISSMVTVSTVVTVLTAAALTCVF